MCVCIEVSEQALVYKRPAPYPYPDLSLSEPHGKTSAFPHPRPPLSDTLNTFSHSEGSPPALSPPSTTSLTLCNLIPSTVLVHYSKTTQHALASRSSSSCCKTRSRWFEVSWVNISTGWVGGGGASVFSMAGRSF